jgi:hypothetical protein
MKLPQLSLRELFLLVALVAMGCGWWVEHWQQSRLVRIWKGVAEGAILQAEEDTGRKQDWEVLGKPFP